MSTFITYANTHNVTVATNTIDNIVIKQQQQQSYNKSSKHKQNLCLDKAYLYKEVEQEIIKRGYNPHIRHRREEKKIHQHHQARRWVVERTNSWHNRFRKSFTRYEKKEENYIGLVELANSLIVYRMLILG